MIGSFYRERHPKHPARKRSQAIWSLADTPRDTASFGRIDAEIGLVRGCRPAKLPQSQQARRGLPDTARGSFEQAVGVQAGEIDVASLRRRRPDRTPGRGD